MGDAKSAEEIIGVWIERLLKLEWVTFGDEIVTEPDRDDVESAMGDVDLVADIQLRFVKFSVRQIYHACGWNDKARDLDIVKKDFEANLFEINKQEWAEQTQKTLDQAYEEQWEWSRIGTELDLDGSDPIGLMTVYPKDSK